MPEEGAVSQSARSLGRTMLRYPIPMATTHQLLDRWEEEREGWGWGVSLLLHPLGQSVTH
jgi:hypothetical protein